ncbi:MAG: hypothetical protein LKJ88_08150 [Bacilli bacterium]|jgi:hypothetical protein|nr:hypothetical protein [Bacilli bacterium]
MDTWLIVLIAILATLLVYLLLGFICYLLTKKREPKINAEFIKACKGEQERGVRLVHAIEELDRHGYNFDQSSYDLLKKGSLDFASLTLQEKAKYKNTCDFTAFYLVKVHKEDKRYGKYISETDKIAFQDYPEEAEARFKSYNHQATIYNALKNMIFTKAIYFLKREKKPDAMIF